MKPALLCGLALLSLAGCSEPEEKSGQMSAEQVAQEMSKMKMEPGQWEATNQILSASAPGVPPEALRQLVGQSNTVSNCVTPEETSRPSASFLAGQKNSDCTYQDFSLDNGKMTGTISCTGGALPGTLVMKMNGDYGPRSYAMNMDMTAANMPGGITMDIKAKTTARRVGECA